MTVTDKNAGERSSWWTERWFLASAGLVAVLVGLAVYVAAGTSGSAQRLPARPAVTAAGVTGRTTSPVLTAGDPHGCALPAGGQTVPTVAPVARWELVGSMAAPAAPAIGPQRVINGLRVCFAHSPLGALYAAVSLWAEGTALPGAEVIARLAADTPARAAAIAAARAQGSGDRLDSETKVQVAGFQFVSYSAGEAEINLAFRTQNGALASVPSTMRWISGDWRYVIPPSGQPGLSQISDLTGFIAWQGA